MSSDLSRRFIFEHSDVRGNLVQLDETYQAVLDRQDYPKVVSDLLGEFLVATLLLSDTIKFSGKLILQARSEGQIPLMMAEATHDRKVRGIARLADEITTSDFKELFKNGSLVVTVDPERGERYQSLVPLVGDCLADSLEYYFSQSVQLNTVIKLSAGEGLAGGMMLQQLPMQLVEDETERANQWQHLSILGQTLKGDEMLELDPATILRRLYPEEALKLLDEKSVEFVCSCSPKRMANALLSLSAEDLDDLFSQSPTVLINCEFCHSNYEFNRETLASTVREGQPTH